MATLINNVYIICTIFFFIYVFITYVLLKISNLFLLKTNKKCFRKSII